MNARTTLFITALGLSALFAYDASRATSRAQGAVTESTQGILGPGAYVYQTRLDEATCEPDSTNGYVQSYFAAINGMPAAREMQMMLLNSPHWPDWRIRIADSGTIIGDSDHMNARNVRMGHSHFEVRQRGDRFVGRGFREYTAIIDGERRRCRNRYDALLKRIDD